MKRWIPLFALTFAFAAAGCGSETTSDTSADTDESAASGAALADSDASVRGLIGTTPDLSSLASQLDAQSVSDALRDTSQSFTIFAPSNSALDAVGPLSAEALRGHVVNTRMFSGDLESGLAIETLNGTELTFTVTDTGLTIRSTDGKTASVVTPDLDAGNGVIHVIDAVLAE